MIGFDKGVNWTWDCRFIRTRRTTARAYDIAGQWKSKSTSMLAAIRLAKQLARAREEASRQDH